MGPVSLDKVAGSLIARHTFPRPEGDQGKSLQFCRSRSSQLASDLTSLWMVLEQPGYIDGKPLYTGAANMPSLRFLTIMSSFKPAHVSIGALPQLPVLSISGKELHLQLEDGAALLGQLDAVKMQWETCSGETQGFIDELSSSKGVAVFEAEDEDRTRDMCVTASGPGRQSFFSPSAAA